jgi:hypothetical protein
MDWISSRICRLIGGRAALAAEVLFLRKQLAYYEEHQIRPRRLTDGARLSLLLCSHFFDWRKALKIVKTETFVRWHRKSFTFYWRWKSRGGRPPIPKDIRQLIARMVKENVTWGEERIADELSLMNGALGTVRRPSCKPMACPPAPPGPAGPWLRLSATARPSAAVRLRSGSQTCEAAPISSRNIFIPKDLCSASAHPKVVHSIRHGHFPKVN